MQSVSNLFDRWRGARGILAAVSGGPDSMAMLALLAQWRDSGNTPEIFAATVDHGLRAEAAREAQLVASFARSLSIPHATLKWEHDGLSTRLQEQARAARYDLLLDHVRQIGATVLMTAHHSDDQAETILFRLLRGSGLAGLAGMAVESQRGDCLLARPLLGLRKSELVTFCESRTIAFCEDPANSDDSFARSRMRTLLPLLAKEGMEPGGWARLARRMARADLALARQAEDIVQALVEIENDCLTINFGALAGYGEEISLRVLNSCIEKLTGAKPRLERAEGLLERLLLASKANQTIKASLGGVQFSLKIDGMLHLSRENARRANLSRK